MKIRISDNPLFDAAKPPIPEIVRAQLAAMSKELTDEQFNDLFDRIRNLYELKILIFAEEIAANTVAPFFA